MLELKRKKMLIDKVLIQLKTKNNLKQTQIDRKTIFRISQSFHKTVSKITEDKQPINNSSI